MIEINHLFYAMSGYILGSIPTGLIFGKIVLKKDISKIGSKTIGASNIFHLSNFKFGSILFFIDSFGKGFLPLLLIFIFVNSSNFFEYASVFTLFVLMGHNWSVFMKFNGGRGQSLIMGSLLILSIPLSILMCITLLIFWVISKEGGVSWIITLLVLMITSLSSITIIDKELIIPITMYLMITIIKRIIGNNSIRKSRVKNKISTKKILFYRLFLDRDILEKP
jgi:glycerol-3-phosphate acyltransferase PlsY